MRMPVSQTTATASAFANSLQQLLAGLAYIDLRLRWAVARARANGLNPQDEFRGLYISEQQVDDLLGYDLGHHIWSMPIGAPANGGAQPTPNAVGEWAAWPEAVTRAREQWRLRTKISQQHRRIGS